MRIHYLQHVPHEGLGYIGEWAKQKHFPVTATRLYEEHAFPEMDKFDFLIIMGGPMSVLDGKDYAWLKAEKEFVVQAINSGKKVLGICLGAQMIAHVLGASIKKSPFTEIGWFPVRKSTMNTLFAGIPEEFTAFHWHGEMFGIPEGAECIFSSDGCPNQGFIYKEKVIGFQFHFETTVKSVDEMLANEKIDRNGEKYVQSAEEIGRNADYAKSINQYFGLMLDELVNKF